jgi:hypothetical protein
MTRYNVGLCAIQSDIGHCDNRLSPISLITDIGLRAHLWYSAIFHSNILLIYSAKILSIL